MTIQEILDYVIETPDNTNPAVLKDMLEALGGGGGSSDFSIGNLNLTVTGGEHHAATVKGVIIDGDALVTTKEYEGEVTVAVVLYKGEGRIEIIGGPNAVPTSLTGDVSVNPYDPNELLIQGDCSATIEGNQGK